MATKLLLVDDDSQVRASVGAFLKRRGCIVHAAATREEGERLLQSEQPDVSIFDYELPDGNAFDLLKRARSVDPQAACIVLTGHASINLAVEAVKLGAEHFLTKPVDVGSLWVLIERTLESRRRQRKQNAQERTAERTRLNPFVGTSSAMRELKDLAEAVLDSEAPVLILGPTGAGKGVLARWLHDNGPRAGEPFVDLNCAGLSKELAESELFGHQKGSFTGAQNTKRGLVEIAHNGSMFLDEIGDLDPSVQPKVLKVLEDRTYRRVGDTSTRRADVRLVSATHRRLGDMAREGTFRNDLLFRINTITFELPALKDRREDIVPIAESMLGHLCERGGKPLLSLGDDARSILERYDWPGNIRELKNVLERAILFSRGDTIGENALRFDRWLNPKPSDSPPQTLVEVEKRHIAGVLRKNRGHVENAAHALGVPRSSLYAKLKKFGISASQS